jgi:excisionase family DNA binding protein
MKISMRDNSRTQERATLTIREAAEALGIGLNQAYEAARSGQIPSIRIGKRIIVPRAAFQKKLEGTA